MKIKIIKETCPICNDIMAVWAEDADNRKYYGCLSCGISFGVLEKHA